MYHYLFPFDISMVLCSFLANSFPIIPVQAVIFLAPLTFNLNLEEDPTVNRIEDSMMIWKSICSNKLLERTTIILFMNKMDVLAATLKSGLRVKDYVISYGDQPNDMPSVVKCMSLPPSTDPTSFKSPSQTSGKNLGRITYVCPFPNRKFSHSLCTEKTLARDPIVLLARNVGYCMSVGPPTFSPLTSYVSRQDTASTKALLLGVREGILLSQLSESSVI